MPRPFKIRCIERLPRVTVFKPAGVPARELAQVTIHLDELEAIRLVDGEGLDQAQAAERMKVSRPTVSRILERVRRKIAQALVEGEALLIEQGVAPVKHVQGISAAQESETDMQRGKGMRKRAGGKGRNRAGRNRTCKRT